ncbi:MAG: hypothetical protein HY015_10330 [Bacteroidetes bacterium]|nr:hypothetical protein [Bacteroidota bacterium]
MSIFKVGVTLESLNKMSVNTMLEHLGIQFTEIGDGTIEARMPVDHRTHQPFGEGFVIGRVKSVHVGKKTHVWEIRITTEKEELVCISRITMAVLDKKI